MLDSLMQSDVVESLEGKAVLCVATTPFQAISLLSVFSSSCSRKISKCDILLCDNYDYLKPYETTFNQSGCFNHVLRAKSYYPQYKHLGLCFFLDSITRRKKARERFYNHFPALRKSKYDVLLAPNADRLALDAKLYCVNNGFTFFYDEGTGSHSGMVFKPLACFDPAAISINKSNRLSFRERVKNVVKRVAIGLLPSAAILNIQGIALFGDGNDSDKISSNIPIYSITPLNLDLIKNKEMLGLSQKVVESYANANVIYLTLPDDVPRESLEEECEVIQQLELATNSSVYIRKHPRRSDMGLERFSSLMLPDASWEVLIASGCIKESHILIGTCSSAQFNPKLLFGIEPTVVFIHKIAKPVSMSSSEDAINQLIRKYTDKQKIYIADTESDLVNFVLAHH